MYEEMPETSVPIIDENGIITGQSTIARKDSFKNLNEQQKENENHHKISVENGAGEGYPDTGDEGDGVPKIKTTGAGYMVHIFNALKMARDYIAIIDQSGKCVWANDAFAGAVNPAGSKDIEGKSIALYIAPEFRKITLDSLPEIKKSGYKTVKLMILSSHGRVPVEANISAINTEEGNLFGYMAIARTIEKDKNRKT
jgi:PAS domain-containing protein